MSSCNPSIKVIILFMWGIDGLGWDWVLEGNVLGSGEALGVADLLPMGEVGE